MSGTLQGTTAIVTGSSSGIGRATALRMAREGAAVCVVADRNVEGGRATAGEIRAAGGRACFVRADVSVAEDCARVVAETRRLLGPVDILVNNAGITRRCDLAAMDEAFWHDVLNTNLTSAYLMTRQALDDLADRRGSVVNVSSVHAVATQAGFSAYAASKAGLCGLTRALALELGRSGVRVNCVLPGTIDITLHPRRGSPPPDPAAWRPRESDVQPLGRLGTPDEVAAVICFLAGPDAAFVHGAAWRVDGALLSILRDRLP